MTKQELQKLLLQMTPEEKINQLLQVVGQFYLDDTVITGPMRENGLSEENIQLAGSVIGMMGAQKCKQIQKEYIEKHPHGIPLLFMLDVINGFKTIFPIPLGQGATFEPRLSERLAKASAREAAVSGVHVTFAPMVDLVRDARWGRVMESTGEDPYLNSLFSAAMVRGFQGKDLKDEGAVAACVKHFAAYGAPTAGRDYNTVELSEHTLREFYLPAYQAGIDENAGLVMTSFNTINGVPATGNKWLMRKILREEMGFDGVLISDWAAIEEIIYHGYCKDRKEAAVRALEAGVDIDMMTGIYSENLKELIDAGMVNESQIDEAVLRILELKNKLGLFENPYKDADEEKEKEVILCREHRELAREAAAKSFVLLKNEDALPVKTGEKIVFAGPYTDSRNMSGAWSFIGNAKDTPTIKEVAERYLPKETFDFVKGSPMLGSDIKLEGFGGKAQEEVTKAQTQEMMEEALAAAKKGDKIVMLLGEDRLQSGEATSSGEIRLPAIQEKLFDQVYEVNKNIVTVLFLGRPLDIRNIVEKSKAVLVVWMPGTEGAAAIMDTLTGKSNPGGKLPMSFPYCVGQVPIHYNEYSTGRPHVPGKDKDRFRSKYLDIPNAPLFPFGFGLSYSEFIISPLKLSADGMKKGEELIARVNVKNNGITAGSEVVQLYIHDVTASVVRPVRELKQFEKVVLEPGEEKEIEFVITEKDLMFYSENGIWESEPGEFEVFAGGDSGTQNKAEFTLYE